MVLRALLASVGLLLFAGSPISASAQLFDFDPAANTNLSFFVRADAGDLGNGPASDTDEDYFPAFIADYERAGGLHDWGAELGVMSEDGIVASTADGFITIDGVLSPTLEIKWSNHSQSESGTTTSNYSGNASSRFDEAEVFLTMNGLTPGIKNSIHLDWSAEATAGPRPESNQSIGFFEFATVRVDWTLAGSLPLHMGGFLFQIPHDSDPPFEAFNAVAGGGTIDFTPQSSTVTLQLTIHSVAYSDLSLPGGNDFSESTLSGLLRLSFVPEPSSFLLLTIALGGFLGWRRQVVRLTPRIDTRRTG
jgi:hypothetical protein